MVIKFTNIVLARHSQIYPNWDFWFENIPSGNPAANEYCDQLERSNLKKR
jgi:hypothetical protein